MKIGKQAYLLYREYFLQAIILEIIFKQNNLEQQNFLAYLHEAIVDSDEILWNTTNFDLVNAFNHLVEIGLIIESPQIQLTAQGIDAVQKATWRNLAASTFMGYKNLYLFSIAIVISIIAVVVSVVAILLNLIF